MPRSQLVPKLLEMHGSAVLTLPPQKRNHLGEYGDRRRDGLRLFDDRLALCQKPLSVWPAFEEDRFENLCRVEARVAAAGATRREIEALRRQSRFDRCTMRFSRNNDRCPCRSETCPNK